VRVWAVLVAAGRGERFGAPKQYERLGDRRVLDWALDAAGAVSEGVVLVVPPDRVGDDEPAAAAVVAGGATRSGSVRAGLAAVPEEADIVLVHDAARPLTPSTMFDEVATAVRARGHGIVPGLAVADTIKRVDASGRVLETVDRSELAAMQRSGRWRVQLHAGRGHRNIRYGAGVREVGPFYAYRDAPAGETTAEYLRRVTDDLDWGEARLREHIPGYAPLAFAPPFGAYGQLGTNDPAIPSLFGRELRERFGLLFVQADPHPAVPGERDVTRLQLDRTTTGGQLHHWLAAG